MAAHLRVCVCEYVYAFVLWFFLVLYCKCHRHFGKETPKHKRIREERNSLKQKCNSTERIKRPHQLMYMYASSYTEKEMYIFGNYLLSLILCVDLIVFSCLYVCASLNCDVRIAEFQAWQHFHNGRRTKALKKDTNENRQRREGEQPHSTKLAINFFDERHFEFYFRLSGRFSNAIQLFSFYELSSQ